jgi:hypothetical protein
MPPALSSVPGASRRLGGGECGVLTEQPRRWRRRVV